MRGDNRFGAHGIHVRNSSNVVVTDNLCHENHYSGIQLVNCSHVLVQANACYDNENGIGLFSRTGLRDPDGPVGGLVVGVNMLYRNTQDLVHGPYGKDPRAFPGLRLHGLHGNVEPECQLVAHPGTLFEWHDERDQAGALYVKVRGSGTGAGFEWKRRRRNRVSTCRRSCRSSRRDQPEADPLELENPRLIASIANRRRLPRRFAIEFPT